MFSPRYALALVTLSLVIATLADQSPWSSFGTALATYNSPPTAICLRRHCRQCIEYNSENRCQKCGPIPGCKRQYGSGGGGGGGALSGDAQAILNAHNGYRAKHCVPNLTWSAQLAAGAQAWASACTGNGQGGFAHSGEAWSSANGFGENLYWGTNAVATNAVDWWYAEIGQYNFAAPAWSGGVAHFTQLVWRNSTQIGCAVAACGGMNLWVCRYSPTGNWNVNNPGVLAGNVPPACK